MVISRVIGVFSPQQWLFRFWRAWRCQLLPGKQGIWTLRAQKSTSQNAYSVLRYPKLLCNIHFERYAICLYSFPLTDFVNPIVYAIWGVMHYESDAKREVWLYNNLKFNYDVIKQSGAAETTRMSYGAWLRSVLDAAAPAAPAQRHRCEICGIKLLLQPEAPGVLIDAN